MINSLKAKLVTIAEQSAAMVGARKTAERTLKSAEPWLIGKRFEPYKSGNLKGVYEITDVDIGTYEGTIRAWGRKVLTNGKLGDRRWELGTIGLHTVWK